MATAKNTNTVLFSITTSALAGTDATHVSLWDAATGGNYLDQQSLGNNPDALVLGERYEIKADKIIITQNKAANESDEMAIRAIRGRIKNGVYVQVHTGAPGANGTNNVISGIARVHIPENGFTVAA